MTDHTLAKLIDFDESIELPRFCRLDGGGDDLAPKWKEFDEVSDIVKLLDEETFDFDLPLSPGSNPSSNTSEGQAPPCDDDEIFFGPMRYKEICVATAVNEEEKVLGKHKPLSPLSASEMAQLCQEAFTVSCRIQLAVGADNLLESASKSATSTTTASPSLVFSPIEEALSNFSKIVPAEKRLSCDENGVIKFQGSSSTQGAEKNTTRPSLSKLRLNTLQSKPSKSLLLQRPIGLRRSGESTIQKLSNPKAPESVLSCVTNRFGAGEPAASGQSPMTKRFRGGNGNAVGTNHNNSKNSSSDVSCDPCVQNPLVVKSPLTAKRKLPEPKTKVSSGLSRLPQLSGLKPPQFVQRLGGTTVLSAAESDTASCNGSTDSSQPVFSNRLQQCGSLRFTQQPTEMKVPDLNRSETLGTSKLVAPKLDVAASIASNRKILSAARSIRAGGSNIGRGPLKAVGPVGAISAAASVAEERVANPAASSASIGNATPQKNRGCRASIGGTTPGSVSRVRPASGLRTPSRCSFLKAPEFSRQNIKE